MVSLAIVASEMKPRTTSVPCEGARAVPRELPSRENTSMNSRASGHRAGLRFHVADGGAAGARVNRAPSVVSVTAKFSSRCRVLLRASRIRSLGWPRWTRCHVDGVGDGECRQIFGRLAASDPVREKGEKEKQEPAVRRFVDENRNGVRSRACVTFL